MCEDNEWDEKKKEKKVERSTLVWKEERMSECRHGRPRCRSYHMMDRVCSSP